MADKELNKLKSNVVATSKSARNEAIKAAINFRISQGMSQRQAMLECEADEGYPLSYSAIFKIIKK